jgi:hypothetical protein
MQARGRNSDATVAGSVALGEAAIPQLVRLVPFDCRSVALSPSDCESGQTPLSTNGLRLGSGNDGACLV